MGLFGDLFGGGGRISGEMPGYLRDRFDMSDDSPASSNSSRPSGKRWICPRCGTTCFSNWERCRECGNYNPNVED